MKQLVSPRTNVAVFAGLCLKYARTAYGAPALYRSAWHAWLYADFQHPGEAPPDGVAVPLWFSHWGSYNDGQGRYGDSVKDPMYGNWGHVVVRHANGIIYSSPGLGYGFKRFQSIREVETYFNAKYVGWTEDINGVQVVAPQPVKRRRQEQIMNIVSYPHGGGRNVKRWYFSGPNYWLPIHVLETAKLLKAQYGIEADSYECANLGELSKFKRAAVGSELDGDDVAGM